VRLLDIGRELVRLDYTTCELVDDYKRTLRVTFNNEILPSGWHLVAHLHLELTADRYLLVKVRNTMLAQVFLPILLRVM
jgi:hypothetical protein